MGNPLIPAWNTPIRTGKVQFRRGSRPISGQIHSVAKDFLPPRRRPASPPARRKWLNAAVFRRGEPSTAGRAADVLYSYNAAVFRFPRYPIMLSATDVHLLVGFLTMSSTPESVEIELGNMIYDQAAEKKRDVDITATVRRADGSIDAFSGIEVKNEMRPLDVEKVEQLACKLGNMPALQRRVIVSASGYTDSAIRKAKFHGIELWHIRTWQEGLLQSGESCVISEWRWHWVEPPILRFNPSDRVSIEIGDAFNQHVSPQLGQQIVESALRELEQSHDKEFPDGKATPVNLFCTLTVPIHLNIGDARRIELREVHISGSLMRVTMPLKVIPKALVRDGEELPYASCVLAEFQDGHLFGFFFGERSVDLRVINVSQRNKRVLRSIRLR